MNQRSPSRTRSHTPTCPEDPEETDVRRRTISKIQQDVERELENADRVLSTVDTYTGSRAHSRAGSLHIKNNSSRNEMNADLMTPGRRSVADPNNQGARNSIKERCPLSDARNKGEEGGVDGRDPQGADGAGYDARDGVFGGPGGPYDGTGAAGGGYEGPGGPYDGTVTTAGGYGGPGGPYDGTGAAGGGYGGPGGPYDGTGATAGGYGGPGGPSDGTGATAGGYGGPGGPYDGTGTTAGGYGGPGGPYDGTGAAGGGYGGPGGPYDGTGAAGGGYGGPGGPYDGTGAAGGGYGGPGGPYDGTGAAGGGYGGPGGPYDGVVTAGVGYGGQEGYLVDGDPYAASKGLGGSDSASRSRHTSKMNYDSQRTSSGIGREAANAAASDGRGRSPPSVHYSPSTALSNRGQSPSGRPSDIRSGFNGDRSPKEAQYSGSRVQSRTGYDPSRDPSGYERGISPTGAQFSASQAQSGPIGVGSAYGEGMDNIGFKSAESHPSPAGGSRGSGGRSSKTFSPTDGSRGTSGMDTKDLNDKRCPAASQGICPAFARGSSAVDRNKATSGSCMSATKRPLTRIEEGPSVEEMPGNEAYGQSSCFPEENFRPFSGRICSQAGRGGFPSGSSSRPQRPLYEVPEQSMYRPIAKDRFQSTASRSQTMGFPQPSMPSHVPALQHEHHHHGHHDHYGSDKEGFTGKPLHERDEKTTLALNRLSQIQKTPSYLKCKPDRGLDLSCCDKSTRGAPKVVKFPEKPCKGMEELQELLSCETRDVESAWYLTSDEKKTYKKPCPKQQKAQENVKSIVKAQTQQPCGKEYTPLEHPDPDDITPELAASMMFSQEQGIKLNECPDEMIKRFFPDIPKPPFPVKMSAVHIVDSNQEDQEEMIEKSAGVPSEGVSDSAYTRTMQNKGEEVGIQKSYDIDFAIGAEKREYVLVAEKPQRFNKVQFRGNLPTWFPGYMEAFPDDQPGIKLVPSPSRLFHKAWSSTNPEKLPSSDIIVLD